MIRFGFDGFKYIYFYFKCTLQWLSVHCNVVQSLPLYSSRTCSLPKEMWKSLSHRPIGKCRWDLVSLYCILEIKKKAIKNVKVRKKYLDFSSSFEKTNQNI